MLKSKIKIHTLGTTYSQPHFFILNRGYHSGKPCPEFWSNCFVFLADDLEDADFHYSIFEGLWKMGYSRRYLVGSAFKFIHLKDLIDIVEETINSVNTGERSSEGIKSTLAQIQACRPKLYTQIDYLIQIRISLNGPYFK